MRLKKLFNKCCWVPQGIHKIITNVGSATGLQDHPYTESDSGPEDFIFPLNGYLAPCTKLSALDNPLSETHGLSKLSPKAVKQGETTARQGMKRKKKNAPQPEV